MKTKMLKSVFSIALALALIVGGSLSLGKSVTSARSVILTMYN